MDIVITGSSGLIGSALKPALIADGHRPIAMVRREPKPGADEIRWDPTSGVIDADALEGIDAVIHLAGAGIADKRWNDSWKKVLVESRTVSTSLLSSTLAGLQTPPKAFISGSAIGIYGDRGDEVLTEESPITDSNFFVDLVQRWEGAAQSAIDAGIRTTLMRTGIVQSTEGGALKKQLPLFKFSLVGKLGSGNQYVSWITMDDQVAAIQHLLTSSLSGPINITAPNPVTNAEYTKTLAKVLGRPAFPLPVPTFGPKLLLGGEMADRILFDSARVHPQALLDDGFTFLHRDLEGGLRALLGK